MEEPLRSQFERTNEEKAAIVYMAAKAIQNKDIWSGVTKTELVEYFKEKGYTEKDLDKTIRTNGVTFKRGTPALEERDGKNVEVLTYAPTMGIRLLAMEFLDRHPEMKNAVVDLEKF